MKSRIYDSFSNNKEEDNYEFFNLRRFYLFIKRNKNSILIYTLIGTLFGGLLLLLLKRTWQGEFQIVLENKTEQSTSQQTLEAASKLFSGINNSSSVDGLETELAILQSPSVLMNIFEFVQKEKLAKGDLSFQNTRFKDWMDKSLKIELLKGTSILELSYKDKDKDLIIPVLNEISNSYQSYSGKKRLRSIELGKKFFNEQINLLTKKSIESSQKVKEFSDENDLMVLNPYKKTNNLISPKSINELSTIQNLNINDTNWVINVEQIKKQVQDTLININIKINQLNNFENNPDQIIWIAKTLPEIANGNLNKAFEKIDAEITIKNSLYKESDPDLIRLKNSRNKLISNIKKQALNLLETQRSQLLAKLEASERPKNVIIEFKQLLEREDKDKTTLSQLEVQYRELLLEEARTEDPWELITSPTLLKDPVSPVIPNVLIIYSFFGFFVGSFIAYKRDEREDLIYSPYGLRDIIEDCSIYEISKNDKEDIKKLIEKVCISELGNDVDKMALIDLGQPIDKLLNTKNKIKDINKTNLFYLNKEDDFKDFTKAILIIKEGMNYKNELIKVINNLNLSSIPNASFIVVKGIKSDKKDVDVIEEIILEFRSNSKKIYAKLKFIKSKYNFKYLLGKVKYYYKIIKNN